MASIIVTVAQRKGGTGKTTLSRLIAVLALAHGVPSAIVEADQQTAESRWAERRRAAGLLAPHVAGLFGGPARIRNRASGDRTDRTGGVLADVLADLRERGAGLIVIDTPPHDGPLIAHTVDIADAVVVPLQPTPNDLEATQATVEIIKGIGRKAGLVINRGQPRTAGYRSARAVLPVFGLPICPQGMGDRMAHQYADGEGLVASEYEPAGKAAEEAAAIVDWINNALLDGRLWKGKA